MASRAELELRAAGVNIDPVNYPNDSKLEQKVIYEEKARTATSTATVKTPGVLAKSGVSGDKNV